MTEQPSQVNDDDNDDVTDDDLNDNLPDPTDPNSIEPDQGDAGTAEVTE